MQKGITLEDIPKEQLDAFGGWVKKSRGRIMILVHPYYVEYVKGYTEFIEELIKKSKVPVLVLEESAAMEKTTKRLAEIGNPRTMVLPTASMRGGILLRYSPTGYEKVDYNRKKLIELLESAGVKTVLMGGMYAKRQFNAKVARAEREWLNRHGERKPHPAREYAIGPLAGDCAGMTYSFLVESGKFDKVRWIDRARMEFGRKHDHASPYVRPKPVEFRIKRPRKGKP